MEPSAVYSGSGNIFVMVDGRRPADCPSETNGCLRAEVLRLCRGNSSDGLVILKDSDTADFGMEFYNPDASCGMMCGNGGRCIAAFASSLGIEPSGEDGTYRFEAPDGIHCAKVFPDGRVRLSMRDVKSVRELPDGGYFLNTGALHRVVFVDDADSVDVMKEGALLRNSVPEAPLGTNVDFVQITGPRSLKIRTFEKGVEAETAACGTGITASALAFWVSSGCGQGVFSVRVLCREDELEVGFECSGRSFVGISLCGAVRAL